MLARNQNICDYDAKEIISVQSRTPAVRLILLSSLSYGQETEEA